MTLLDLLDKLSEARKRFGDVEIVFVERRLYFGKAGECPEWIRCEVQWVFSEASAPPASVKWIGR